MSNRIDQRDLRLDFFQGLAVFMILVDHLAQNFWAFWMPTSFGFSNAIEIFVFCSGMVAASMFANVYVNEGWLRGTAFVLQRTWQVYWAYIAVFLLIAATRAVASTTFGPDFVYANDSSLAAFFADPSRNLLALLTLTYVPDYIASLPIYTHI